MVVTICIFILFVSVFVSVFVFEDNNITINIATVWHQESIYVVVTIWNIAATLHNDDNTEH